MSTQTPHITASLRLVKSELDLLLRHGEQQLSEYANYLANREAWEQASLSLRQVAGVLEVIGVPGAQELARILAQSVESLGDSDETRAASLLPAQVHGLHLLSRYLDRSHLLGDYRPAVLLPAINSLRQQCQLPPLPEDRYFARAASLPHADRGFVLDPDIRRLPWFARRLRHMYQLGLLAVLREENLGQGFFLLKRALLQVENLCGETVFADFMRLTRAAVEALDEGRLHLSRERRLILGQIDRQLKRLLIQPLELEGLDIPPPLVHSLIYWLALSEPATALLQEMKRLAGVDGHFSEALLTLERAVLEDAGEGALPAARQELRTELGKLIHELDVLNAHAELVREAPNRLVGQLSALALTFEMLDLPEDGLRLRQAAERVEREATTISREQLLSLAGELMDVDVRLAELVGGTSVNGAVSEAAPNPQVQASQEARQQLSKVQDALTAYIANDWDIQCLEEVPAILDNVCAGLQFLRSERAAVVLHTCAEYIRHRLVPAETPPGQGQALEILADAIICIDYYLDGLAGNQGLRQGVIELAEESADALMRLTRAA